MIKRLPLFLLLYASVAAAQGAMPPIVNVGEGPAPAGAPAFSPPAGTFAGAQTITIASTTRGVPANTFTITNCTTTSGTCTPNMVGASVALTTSSNICAFATGTGFLQSPTSCADYVITPIPVVLQVNASVANCTVTCTITLPSHAAGGLTCVGDVVQEPTAPTAISNTAGFTWSSFHTQSNSVGFTVGWSCAPTLAFGSTDTVTVTNPTGTNHAALVVVDVGSLTNSTVDLFQGAAGTSSAASTGSMALSGPGDMVLFIARTNSAAVASVGTCITCTFAGGNWGSGSFQLAASVETNASTLTVGTTNTSTSWAVEAVALH
jgi:hypothetical protein